MLSYAPWLLSRTTASVVECPPIKFKLPNIPTRVNYEERERFWFKDKFSIPIRIHQTIAEASYQVRDGCPHQAVKRCLAAHLPSWIRKRRAELEDRSETRAFNKQSPSAEPETRRPFGVPEFHI